MDNVVILITGIGAPGTIGTVAALKNSVFTHRLIGIDIKPSPANRFFFDEFYCVPPPEHPDFISNLFDLVCRENVSLILPQVTRELEPLSSNKELFAESGCSILVNDYENVKVLNNKYELMQAMSRMGLKVPEHYLIKTKKELQKLAYQLGYPKKKVVIKPPVSNGMRGLRILTEPYDKVYDFLNEKPDSSKCSLVELLSVFEDEEIPELIVSEYLPGEEISVDCLCKDGESILVLPRTRNEIRSGITFSGTAIQEENIITQTREIIGQFQLSHALGFQFKYDENASPQILECNPRIQGTMVFGAFCGANVILGAVYQALNIDLSFSQSNIDWEVSFARYWGGLAYKKNSFIEKI
jgi:carbamoyl-phosphate synthase large subunit